MSASSIVSTSSKSLSALLKSKDIQWAAGGWIFFIAENAILSENRTYLIAQLGDDKYHLIYGTLSTIATGSIGYSYYRLQRQSGSTSAAAANALKKIPRSPIAMGTSWVLLTVGLGMATQALPKFQIPISVGGGGNSSSSGSGGIQVRCPFDFKEPKRDDENTLYGLERVTRHAGLWSLGFIGLGQSVLLPPTALPLKIWWMGPAMVAWLGGSHTDSRFRRGMGGTLDPLVDAQTSNVPFAAMITGQQGNVAKSFQKLLSEEMKPLNAIIATAASTGWMILQARRFRIR